MVFDMRAYRTLLERRSGDIGVNDICHRLVDRNFGTGVLVTHKDGFVDVVAEQVGYCVEASGYDVQPTRTVNHTPNGIG